MSTELDDTRARPPRPRYIAGVYNYCDRWCERCPYKARCVVAATRDLYDAARARGEDLESVKPPDEEPDVDDGIERPWLEDAFRQPTEAEMREYEARETERQRVMEADPLILRAREYSDLGHRIGRALHAQFDGQSDPVVLTAVDTIEWLALGIGAKVWRAVGGELRGLLDDEDFDEDDVQSDANGSAKIARLMVAESRDAWAVLMQVGRAIADGLPVKMIERLGRLDQDLAVRFPRAMDFTRPGFDQRDEST